MNAMALLDRKTRKRPKMATSEKNMRVKQKLKQ